MSRKIETKKIIHKPATKEIFFSLSSMPQWSKILLGQKENTYTAFLKWLIDKNYLIGEKDISIKNIAKAFGADTPKITKWLAQIYEDLLVLNEEQPELFKREGTRHELHFRYYDSYAFITIWLQSTPRIHERFSFYFLKARLGSNFFYVHDVEHIIGKGGHTVSIGLAAGFVNRYREQLVDRAEFEGMIDFGETLNPFTRDLDDKLRKWYR
jgi:hypothetical protein